MKAEHVVAGLIVGLFALSSLWMLTEWARPGLTFGAVSSRAYGYALTIHGFTGVLLGPLALVVAGWLIGQAWLSRIGWLFMIGQAILGIFAAIHPATFDSRPMIALFAVRELSATDLIVAALTLWGVAAMALVAAMAGFIRNWRILWAYLPAALIATVAVMELPIELTQSEAAVTVMRDTQLETALVHGMYYMPALLIGAALLIWWQRERIPGLPGIVLLGLAALALRTTYVAMAQAGLMGMPRRYADYPDAFAPTVLTLCLAAGAALTLVAGALTFARLGRQS